MPRQTAQSCSSSSDVTSSDVQTAIPAGNELMALSDAVVAEHDVTKRLLDQKSIKEARFSISKDLYRNDPNYDNLPARLEATIDGWVNKAQYRLKATFHADNQHDTLTLHELLIPSLDFEWMLYADGRQPPRRSGLARARLAAAEEDGEGAAEEKRTTVDIKYTEGGRELMQTWTYERPEAVTVDQREQERFAPKLNCEKAEIKSPYTCFLNAAMPAKMIEGLVTFWNQRLQAKDHSSRKATIGEAIQFFGYMAAIALYPGEKVDDMWRDLPTPGDILPPPALGRHGMSKNRFKTLRALTEYMHTVCEGELDPNDPWRYCRWPINTFNEHMREIIEPGWGIMADESMSPYLANDGKEHGDLPKQSFVPRKPKPIGAEIKNTADALSKTMLFLELCEGEEAHSKLKFADEFSYSSAMNLRLTEAYHGTWRLYGADAHFMSVDEMEALLLKAKLHCLGPVKGHTKRFPVKELTAHCGPEPGAWAVMSTVLESGHKIFAIAHRRGGEVHHFLSSCGKTVMGRPQKLIGERAFGFALAPRKAPQVLNDWTLLQPVIDMLNRWRQDILGIEERFITHNFPFRLFTTVLGMIFVNAYNMFNYFIGDMDFKTFIKQMAYDAMTNDYDYEHRPQTGRASPVRSRRAEASAASSSSPYHALRVSPRVEAKRHYAVPISSIGSWKGKKQQRCAECGVLTGTCCAAPECSNGLHLVAVHRLEVTYGNITTKFACISEHQKHPQESRRVVASAARKAAGKKRQLVGTANGKRLRFA